MTKNDCPPDATAAAETELSKPAEANLLEWLEDFATKLKGRTNAVADEVQQVVEEMNAVELNLQITFNNFRCLSSSQFVENHVYEEDETDLVTAKISKKDAKKPSVPTESYEDEILPRYKDAVAFAWAAFQGGSRQNDQSYVKPGSQSKLVTDGDLFNRQRNLHPDGMIQILPHIIGTEEFTRDVCCGLADLRHRHRDPESDNNVRQDRASLVAEPIDTGILSEGEISGTDSDGFDSQEGIEPAVSAALDFKAMLEAALRNPYDGGTSNDSFFGGFADNKFSLSNVTSDGMDNSPRSISTMVDIIGRTMSTMDESKEQLRDSTSRQSNANDDGAKVPLATEPPEDLDNSRPSGILEELLKKPLNSQAQPMSNQKFKLNIDSNNGNRHLGTGDLGRLPIIPGGFFNEEVRDTGILRKEDASVSNSNTGPTIPEGLFQEELWSEPVGSSTAESQSFTSLDSRQILPTPLPSIANIVPRSSSGESDIVSINSDRDGSGKSQVASSVITNHASLHSGISSISSGLNVFLGSQQGAQLPSRGGLFDDDDEDEDAGELFGVPAPRVDSHGLPPWASQSSKRLFDDIATATDGTTSVSDEAGVGQEIQENSDISSLITSQYTSQSGLGVLDSLTEPVVSGGVETYSISSQVDLARSSDPRNSVSNNPGDLKEVVQLPIHTTVAATVRSVIVESDDDPWSESESGVHDLVQGNNVIHQQIQQDAATTESGNNDSEANPYQRKTAEGILGLMPDGPVGSGHLAQSVSSEEEPLPVAIHEGNIVSSYEPAPEVLPSGFPPTTARTFSSTETAPVKVSVKLAEDPLMQSTILGLSDAEASDSSDSASSSGNLQGVGQRGPVQNIFSNTSNLSENFRLPTSQSPKSQPSFSQNTGNNLVSEDWRTIASKKLAVSVNELGRSTRTFTPLFDEDEAEEDLFGRKSPQHQGALFPRTGQPGIVLSSDTTVPITPEQSRIEETQVSLISQNVHSQQPPEPNPSSDFSSSSRPASVEKKDVVLSSAKSGSKLSSLLFGDDDEDDEDALFGPLGGQTSRGLKSWTGG